MNKSNKTNRTDKAVKAPDLPDRSDRSDKSDKMNFTQEVCREMYDALKEIASMQPGESYDDECDIYEDCGHCWDMISIAKDALKKARGEE